MEIDADTKIYQLLKAHPEALEAIVSISPRFKKLRNPVLRKIIAARTSIRTAAGIGNCTINDFYTKLSALGFVVNDTESTIVLPTQKHPKSLPRVLENLHESQYRNLDVRPIIENNEDPLRLIMEEIKNLPEGNALKLINSFEPTPLIDLLNKKGFLSYVERLADNEIHTYFYKVNVADIKDEEPVSEKDDWEIVLQKYSSNRITIDVRALPMPQPMHTILESLSQLKRTQALFVHHKRVPVFLLPELEEKGFEYRIHSLSNGEVEMLIFKS